MSAAPAIQFLLAAIAFIVGIKLLGSPKTARLGNLVAAAGMAFAIIALLPLMHGPGGGDVPAANARLIVLGLLLGLGVGAYGAYAVKMTAMPQMVALFNGAGGGAAALVAALEFVAQNGGSRSAWFTSAMLFAALIGAVSFSGSFIAFLKLEGKFEKPVTSPVIRIINIALVIATLVLGICFACTEQAMGQLMVFLVLALALGVLMVLPIGGADMPVAISLLNSFTGLAVAADGFAIANVPMIIAGTLVGSSGTILTLAMCKAMNRPVTNVLFAGFGSTEQSSDSAAEGEMKAMSVEDAWHVLEAANDVVIVPGYGLAVAQAQHAAKELAALLEKRGAQVRFAIHPVAGRMPGHMNVLLAEADVPYEQLVEMAEINPSMPNTDVVLVVGANDVVNPAAVEDKASPIFGMPIINAYQARTVFVLKRGQGAGFSGLVNTLFFRPNCRMIYGDAKATLQALVGQFENS